MLQKEKAENLWQEESNCIWFTNRKPVCSLCGKEKERVIELKVKNRDEGLRVCLISENECLHKAMNLLFNENPDVEYLLMRSIEYKLIKKIS